MAKGERIHRKSWDAPWTAHALTFSCFARQGFFRGRQSPRWFLEVLDEARVKTPFDLWAFVIMPEHVHLLILPHEGVFVRAILAALKQPMTRRILNWVEKNRPGFLSRMADRQPSGKTTYRFWQRGGGYDRNMRSTREIHEKIRYIHDNPVRSGLVQRAEDWPWSSARAWETDINEPIRLDRQSCPQLCL